MKDEFLGFMIIMSFSLDSFDIGSMSKLCKSEAPNICVGGGSLKERLVSLSSQIYNGSDIQEKVNTRLHTIPIVIVNKGTGHQTQPIRILHIFLIRQPQSLVRPEHYLDTLLSLVWSVGLGQMVVFV